MLAGADTADAHAVKLDFLQVTTGKGVKSGLPPQATVLSMLPSRR